MAPLMCLQSSGLEFKPAEIEAEYALNVLWLDKSIGLAVDQIFKGVGGNVKATQPVHSRLAMGS